MSRSLVLLALTMLIAKVDVVQAQDKTDPNSLPRVVSLTIKPSRLDAAAKNLVLMPKAEELTKGNAATFYIKATEVLPADLDMDPVWEWRNTPLRDLPQDEVNAVLEQVKTSLDLLRQGARCKSCKWQPVASGTLPPGLAEYRQLACLLCVQARLEIAQGQYEKALETIRTGLAASKHVGEAPTIVQGVLGVAMASLVLLPVGDLAQAENAPNLYSSLHALPRPLVDMEVPISAEDVPWAIRLMMKREIEEAHEKVRMLMRRLDANVAALECIEALRHYAAGHDGRLPAQLSDITDLRLPNDPATGKPFAYRVDGSKAVLETAIPKGGEPRDGTRYEIAVAH